MRRRLESFVSSGRKQVRRIEAKEAAPDDSIGRSGQICTICAWLRVLAIPVLVPLVDFPNEIELAP
jgi:hypothetical protein